MENNYSVTEQHCIQGWLMVRGLIALLSDDELYALSAYHRTLQAPTSPGAQSLLSFVVVMPSLLQREEFVDISVLARINMVRHSRYGNALAPTGSMYTSSLMEQRVGSLFSKNQNRRVVVQAKLNQLKQALAGRRCTITSPRDGSDMFDRLANFGSTLLFYLDYLGTPGQQQRFGSGVRRAGQGGGGGVRRAGQGGGGGVRRAPGHIPTPCPLKLVSYIKLPCQAGKAAALAMLALFCLMNKWCERVVLILGVGRVQWKETGMAELEHVFDIPVDKFDVLHNQDLEGAKAKFKDSKNTLFLIDEPQQGFLATGSVEENSDQHYHTYSFFKNAGVSSVGAMRTANNRIVFASATPNQTLIDAEELLPVGDGYGMLPMPTSPTYYSVNDMLVSPCYIAHDHSFWTERTDSTGSQGPYVSRDARRNNHVKMLVTLMQVNRCAGVRAGYWVLRVPPESRDSSMKNIVEVIKSATTTARIQAAIVPLTSALDLDSSETVGRARPPNKVHAELDQPTPDFLEVIRSRLQSDSRLRNSLCIHVPAASNVENEVIVLVKGKYLFSDRVSPLYLRMWWSGCQESFDLANQDPGRPLGAGKEHGPWILAPRLPLEQQALFSEVGTYRKVDYWKTTGSSASSSALDGGAQVSLVPSYLSTLELDTDDQKQNRLAERNRNRDALSRLSRENAKYSAGACAAADQVNEHFSGPDHLDAMVYYPAVEHRAPVGFICIKIGRYLEWELGEMYLSVDQFRGIKNEVERALAQKQTVIESDGQTVPTVRARQNPVGLVRERAVRLGHALDEQGQGWPCSLRPGDILRPMTVDHIIRRQLKRSVVDNYVHGCLAYLKDDYGRDSMVWLVQFALSDRERQFEREEGDVDYSSGLGEAEMDQSE